MLYRMSYSSIIRESQDLGAGLFDRDYNTLCESDSTPMHIGSLPGYLRGIEKTVPLDAWKPGDCVDPQPSLLRRQPFARHRHRHAGLLRAASWSASRPTPRTMSTSARRRPASSSTSPMSSPRACCSTG